jgi:hypothetical protein
VTSGKNELNTNFEENFNTGSYGVGIGRAWCSHKACEICSSLAQKKNLKKKKTFTEAIQIAINHFLISRKFWG